MNRVSGGIGSNFHYLKSNQKRDQNTHIISNRRELGVSNRFERLSSIMKEHTQDKTTDRVLSHTVKAGNNTSGRGVGIIFVFSKSGIMPFKSKHSHQNSTEKSNERSFNSSKRERMLPFEEINVDHPKTDEEWQPEDDWLVENLIAAPAQTSNPATKKEGADNLRTRMNDNATFQTNCLEIHLPIFSSLYFDVFYYVLTCMFTCLYN